MAYGILGPWPGIEPAPFTLTAQTLNRTTREALHFCFYRSRKQKIWGDEGDEETEEWGKKSESITVSKTPTPNLKKD